MSDEAAGPPSAALVLGLAGLLPVAAVIVILLTAGAGLGWARLPLVLTSLGYCALILSFLGGMWWSAACNQLSGAALWRWLAFAVLPSLWSVASFAMGLPRGTAMALAAGLIFALAADRAAMAARIVPGWWMRLRAPLSLGLAIETLLVGWLA